MRRNRTIPLRLRRAARRWCLLGLGSAALLGTGPCLTTLEQSVVRGFFDAITPRLVDAARDALGLTDSLAEP